MSKYGNRISDFTEKISAIFEICGRKKIFGISLKFRYLQKVKYLFLMSTTS